MEQNIKKSEALEDKQTNKRSLLNKYHFLFLKTLTAPY